MPDLFHPIGEQAAQVASTTSENGTNGLSLGTDEDFAPVEKIESLCMNCHEDGITRLLLTKIPYFREVIISSFKCDKCGFHNNEIQPAGTIELKGARYELRLTEPADLQRQVVKSDNATVKFIEVDAEIPAGRGQLTTVEGLVSGMADDLETGQPTRKEQNQQVYEKVQAVIDKCRAILAGSSFPFRLVVDDPTGNSFVQPDVRDGVGKWEKREYQRTREQNTALGLVDTAPGHAVASGDLDENGDIVPDQVYQFPTTCPGCAHPCTTNMKLVDIPHFRQIVLMAVNCADCGFKSSEVKTGGAVPEKGKVTTLKVDTSEDLSRDILKSESCTLECPELGLSVQPGTLGGRFSTVEGLLTQVRDDLHGQIYGVGAIGRAPAGAAVPTPPETAAPKEAATTAAAASSAETAAASEAGDSLSTDERTKWRDFFDGLADAIEGRRPFTVVLRDPMGASYVQSLSEDPSKPDAKMTVEEYERTEEEDDDLGLKDMKVEGYEQDGEVGPSSATVGATAAPAG